jgi:Bacterial Ig-like domain (group 2).
MDEKNYGNATPQSHVTPIEENRPNDIEIGNYFFIPASGYCSFVNGYFGSGQWGEYWLSTPYPDNVTSSYNFHFPTINSTEVTVEGPFHGRENGLVPLKGGFDNELKLESVKIESTTGSYNVEVNKTLQMKATAYFTDKTGTKVTRDVTNESTWTSTPASVATVDNTTIKGNVTGLKEGTSTITADYKFAGVTKSDTKTVNVLYKIFTVKDFYQWDAWEPCDFPDGGIWGPGSSGFNPSITEDAKKSCKYAMTLDAIKMYLAAGVFWVTDGPAYQLPNGNILGVGLMIKKSEYIPGFEENEAEKVDVAYSHGSDPKVRSDFNTLPQSEKDKYFFLPISGSCSAGGTYGFPGYYGYYWLSTRYEGGSNTSFIFVFSNGFAYPSYSGTACRRKNCYLPLIGVSYDSTYVEPKKY